MKITAIRTVVRWDGEKIVVLNPGESGELNDTLAREEIDARNAEPADGTGSSAEPLRVGSFTLTYKPVGSYVIAGPGLDEPETVRGKAAAEARVQELQAALGSGSGEDGDSAPPVD